MLKGNWTRNSQRYICDSNGNLTTGFLFEDEGGMKYLWAGQILSGWQTVTGVTWGNSRLSGTFYFDPENSCYRAVDQAKINGVTHYFNTDGSLRNGVMTTDAGTLYLQEGVPAYGWFEVDGEYRYFDEQNGGYMTSDTIEELATLVRQLLDYCRRILETIQVIQSSFGVSTGEQL